MKVTGVAVSLYMVVCVVLGQNNDFNMLNMNNANWDFNTNNLNNNNNFNNDWNNMNNWNGLNTNNWNGFNSNRNNWNSMFNMNNRLNRLMNNMNILNTNMRNINGGRDDPARKSEGIFDDARPVSAKHFYITEPAHPVTVITSGDAGFVPDLMAPSSENVMVVATRADDPSEGHVIIASGENIGMMHKTDV